LKLLRIVEQAGLKHTKILSEEWENYIKSELNIAGLKYFARLFTGNGKTEQDMFARRRDYLSHFILQLAYCRSEELRRWFIAREMEIFRFKFSKLSKDAIKELVETYEIGYRPITDEQKQEIRAYLQNGFTENIDDIDFYKVNFLSVLDLVRQRKCFLKSGFAYVSSKDFSYIIGNHHQAFIERNLAAHLKLLPEFENDDRIVNIIKGLHNSYAGKDYTINKDVDIPIESLDQLSLKSYPICMRNCHEAIRSSHHIKHGGRIQYGLFLKGIGVSLEDSLRFWREEFTKIMEPDKFDKSYAYNVRYNYGKEGSRTNWSPYSCMKIIMSPVGAQDVCGCPFKTWDAIELRKKLISYGLNQVQVQDVLSYASKGHFQLACGRYFELTHNAPIEEGVNHPNGYFENSQIIMGNRQGKQKSTESPSQQNIKRQNAMTKQQEVRKRWDARVKVEREFDDALWELSQHEQELIEKFKGEEAVKEKINQEVSQLESMVWDDEDDVTANDSEMLSNYL
jgi:DNA primase large subunit